MFDIGFWELIIIAVVALVVVGPERFPGMIKKVGYWMGQFRRIAASVKSEIQIEVDKAEQLQNLLDEQKQIMKRNMDIDLSQPAVKSNSETSTDSTEQTPEAPQHNQVPIPKPTPAIKSIPDTSESGEIVTDSVSNHALKSEAISDTPQVAGDSTVHVDVQSNKTS